MKNTTKTDLMEKQKPSKELPKWLTQANSDPLKVSKKNYISNNLKTVIGLLNYFLKATPDYKAKSSVWLRLLIFIAYTVIIVMSTNGIFLWILALILAAKMIFLPGDVIWLIVKRVVKLSILSAIFILPSLLLGNRNIGLFVTHIALIMMNLSLFLTVTPWPDFIRALEDLHLPHVIILTLDITIKYMYNLGCFLEELLYSIRLRTLGQHVSRRLIGAIIGHLYLASKKRTTELYQAMQLRGYGQKRHTRRSLPFNKFDVYNLAELVAVFVIFIFFMKG